MHRTVNWLSAAVPRDREELRRLGVTALVPLLAGFAIGGLVVLVEVQGAGDKPAPVGAAVLLVAVVAALAPLRIALPIAVVLSAYEGFFTYFVGGHSTLWEECFTVVLVVRAALQRPPSRLELAAAALVFLVFTLYFATGTDAKAVGLGAKLLVFFVLVGWALARLGAGRREWWAVYRGLGVVVASGVVVAVWQRNYGVNGLEDLGLRYGASIREAGGQLRANAGFVYAAPFGYTLAAALLCWVALVMSGERRRAFVTLWIPALAVVGMALSLSRTAFVAAVGAVILVALGRSGARRALVGVAIAAVAVVLVVAPSTATFIGRGFTGSTGSAAERRDIWQERASHLSAFGAGPGSVGSAVTKVHPELEGDPNDTRNKTLLRRGVVDNQYLAWLYQYGYIGGALVCLLWVGFLGAVLLDRTAVGAAGIAAQLVAGFALIAAMSVNVWEEFPINFLLAVLIGLSLASGSLSLPRRGRPAVAAR